MPRSARTRIAVRIDELVWHEEVERFNPRSRARIAAERERAGLEESGVELRQLRVCSDSAPDGTRLAGMLKVYVPIRGPSASQRPFGFVFSPARLEADVVLRMIAFGERHPRKGTRSVYERAHKRVHGRYSDQ